MEPYFISQNGKLYHADCMEVMRGIDGFRFDLVLTDPPYGIGEAAGKNRGRGTKAGKKDAKNTRGTAIPSSDFGSLHWDNVPPTPEYFDMMRAVSLNQIIFGGNYFPLPPTSCWIVWDKDNGGNDFADCELAWTSFDTAVRKIKYRWNGFLQGNLSATSPDKEKRVHPTQKPVAVMKWILERYSEPGDLILDPFLGSGPVAIACEQMGRKWVGVEREEQYCEVAAARLSQPMQKSLVA